MKTHFILFAFIFRQFQICTANQCKATVPTIRPVSACPRTEEEWKKAEEEKKCENLADFQNCSSPSDFRYHCLRNSHHSATLELCAPTFYSPGYCFEYDTQLSEIRFNHEVNCTSCPARYSSIDAYKHQSCYNLLNVESICTDPTCMENGSVSNTERNNNGLQYMFPVLITAFVIVLLFGAFFLYLYLRGWRISKQKKADGFQDDGDVTRRLLDSGTDGRGNVRDIYYCIEPDHKLYGEFEGDDLNDMADKNKRSTTKALKQADVTDKYYVETKVYRKIEGVLLAHDVVTVTGLSGIGKTAAGLHLMLKMQKNWALRIMDSYTELACIEKTKNTVVFIDNAIKESEESINQWVDVLEKLNKIMGRRKNEDETGRIRLIIIADKKIVEYMNKLLNAAFNKEYVIDMDDPTNDLDRDEKENILQKKFLHAYEEKAIDPPEITDQFWTKLSSLQFILGFPLCAHLFAFEKGFRCKGVDFFECPTVYITKQVRKTVSKDEKNKLLLFLLFLQEIYGKEKLAGERLDIMNRKKCHAYLRECRFRKKTDISDFKNLDLVASKLTWLFLLKEKDGVFRFIHPTVYHAVETCFFQEQPEESIEILPYPVIERQTQDETWMTELHFEYLIKRFIEDVKNGKCAGMSICTILKKMDFVEHFTSNIESLPDDEQTVFLTKKSIHSPYLPILFWLGKHGAVQMIQKLLTLAIVLFKDEDKQLQHILFFVLFGECCKVKSPKKSDPCNTNGEGANIYGIKRYVTNFEDNAGSFIDHIIVQSEFDDEYVEMFIKELIPVSGVDRKNASKQTPLMLAARCKQNRQSVFLTLISKSRSLNVGDHRNNTVLHHCVCADIDDIACAKRIYMILKDAKDIDLNFKNEDGLTPLNLACKEKNHSRILSICILLHFGDFSQDVNSIDKSGNAAIFNAISELGTCDNELIKMERLLRVYILMVNNSIPYVIENNSDRATLPNTARKRYSDIESIIENFASLKAMERILGHQLTKVSSVYTVNLVDEIDTLLYLPKELEEIKNLIKTSVLYLAKKDLL